jgi:ureidoacrylate peracid hydrolase
MSQNSNEATAFNFGLVVVNMQNGFVSKGGSYDHLGMNIQEYKGSFQK